MRKPIWSRMRSLGATSRPIPIREQPVTAVITNVTTYKYDALFQNAIIIPVDFDPSIGKYFVSAR